MSFKHYRLRIILNFIIIFVFSYLAMYVIITTPHWKISVWLSLPVIISVVALIKQFESHKREISDFLLEIKQDDASRNYVSSKDDLLGEIQEEIITVIKRLRHEKELNHQYLITIVEHIKIAILCFDENGNVVLKNQAFNKLINRSTLSNIESISKLNTDIYEICKAKESGQKKLIKVEQNGQLANLSVLSTKFKMKDESFTIISLQNIDSELELKELESWKKLVRILTHEIMNTSIPISTLTNVINDMFYDDEGNQIALKDLSDKQEEYLIQSLKTIEKRSKGIVEFVKATKSYTNIPKPVFKNESANELIKSVLSLIKPEIENNNIKLNLKLLAHDHDIKIDQNQIEQVLINVIKNAIEALADSKEPQLSIGLKINEESRLKIEIQDNGKGLSNEEIENIFIPFYTTKKEGSGIGLTLSKSIMNLHGGSIYAISEENRGSVFTLVF